MLVVIIIISYSVRNLNSFIRNTRLACVTGVERGMGRKGKREGD